MKFSAPLCFLTLILCCCLNLPVAAQQTDRSPFALEFPELSSGQLTAPKNYVARADVNTIKFWILNPAADTIDWGKIKVRINNQSANIVCSQNAATLGKVLKCDLNRIAGFRLKPKDNLFEIEAVSRDGNRFYGSFIIVTDANAVARQGGENNNSGTKIAPGAMGFSGRKFAVVIGVSEYKYNDIGLGNLDFPDDDADAFYAWLTQTGGFNPQNILYLTNENATLSAVRDSLNRFLTKATENDLVFFFLAGHGTPDPFDPRELYYLVYDSKIADLKNTGFPMTELKQIVDAKLKSKRAVFLLDTCHSAGISEKKKIVVPPREVKLNNTSQKGGRDVSGNDFNERQLMRVEVKNGVSEAVVKLFGSPGRAVLVSSDTNETSRESERWGGGHGVFTWALLEGLRGNADANSDKIVTTDELFTFVRQKVRAETNEKQNPRLFSNLGGGLEIAVLK